MARVRISLFLILMPLVGCVEFAGDGETCLGGGGRNQLDDSHSTG
jgi:hypothetical protein